VRAQATAAPGFAKMHDFCMTLPYGALVALGGLAGFLSKGKNELHSCTLLFAAG
jgi:hypothetical protein